MRNLSPLQVQQLIEGRDDLLLLDVREPWEFETCAIETSINIPMAEIPGTARELQADKVTVVICHHGARSMQVAHYLEQTGFADVINLDGGVDAWARTIDPGMQQY